MQRGLSRTLTVRRSAALQGYLERLTGPLYEPRTTAGRYAQTVGEFLPAVLGGRGSLAARAASSMRRPGNSPQEPALSPMPPSAAPCSARRRPLRPGRDQHERAIHCGLYSLEDAVKEFAYEEVS